MLILIYINTLIMYSLATLIERGYFVLPSVQYYTMDIQPNNVIHISNGIIYVWQAYGSVSYVPYSYYSPISNYQAIVKSNPWNSNFSIFGDILVFDNCSMCLFNITSGICQQINIQTTHETIINSCFGRNLSQIFVLIFNSSMEEYQVLYYQGDVINSTRLTAVKSSSLYNKMLYLNNVLYISFTTGIQILAGDVTLRSLKSIKFPSIQTNYIDITADQLAFAYSHNQSLYILSNINYKVLWKTTLNQSITGIKIIACYLIVYSNPYLYQIDLQLVQIVYTLRFTYPGIYLLNYVYSTGNLFLYSRDNISNTGWYMLDFRSEYLTFNATCLPTYIYYFFNYSCVKDYSAAFIIDKFKKNDDINETNSTQIYAQILNFLSVVGFTDKLGQSMVFTSFKITPNFLLAFTVFFDDIWYYRYHRKVYPAPIQMFMEDFSIINDLRLSPWLLDFIVTINKNYICQEQNEQRYKQLNFNGSDPEDVYFLYSSEDIYQETLLQNILILLVLKLFSVLANGILTKCSDSKIISSIANFLKYNTRLWVLLIAIIESNTIKLAFNSFIQLLSNGVLKKQDKLNLVVTFAFLFILLIYSLCFYPLLFAWEPKEYSEILLIKCKYRLGGFYCECINLVCRNLVRGFIHSFFINNYPLQIGLLTGVDLIFVFVSFKALKYYKLKIVGVLCALYFVTFFFFDLYFFIQQINHESVIQTWDPNKVSSVILLTLACIAIFISSSLLLNNIYKIIKKMVKKCRKYFFADPSIQNQLNKKDTNSTKEKARTQKRQKISNSKKLINSIHKSNKILNKSSSKEADPTKKQKTQIKIRIKIRSQKTLKDELKIQNSVYPTQNKIPPSKFATIKIQKNQNQ